MRRLSQAITMQADVTEPIAGLHQGGACMFEPSNAFEHVTRYCKQRLQPKIPFPRT